MKDKTYYTTDGGNLAPYPNMTDAQLRDFWHRERARMVGIEPEPPMYITIVARRFIGRILRRVGWA